MNSISIAGLNMTYGSKDAICTWNAGASGNVCVLQNVNYDMGEMCAHRVIPVNGFAVVSCSKKFTDGSTRKVQILKIDDGAVAGVASLNASFNASINDQIAVRKTNDGI